MEGISPHQPPLPQGPPGLPLVFPVEPPSVKVFGILHLVFAGLGILGALWGLFIAMMGNPFLALTQGSPGMNAQMEAQLAMQEKVKPMSIASAVLSLLVAIPMIVAGVRLLKKRGSGLKWSNIYAWSSLGAKAVNLALTMGILIPAMQEMTRTIVGSSRMPGFASSIMSGSMIGGAIIGVLVPCIYPALVLIILNRPTTKEWFARQPG